jgi:hypothetical protein
MAGEATCTALWFALIADDKASHDSFVRQVDAIFSAWGVKRTSVLVAADVPGAREFWCAVGYPCDEHINRHVRTT